MSWGLAASRWFLLELGGFERLSDITLLRPTREHFPLAESVGHARALELFGMVRDHAGLQARDCRLELHPDAGSLLVAGSYVRDEDTGQHVITYSRRILEDTQGMVATLAHECGHVLLADAREVGPGGPAAIEPATDLAAIFLGFGIFLANSALRQEREDPTLFGPGGPQGYLNEKQASFLLALFVRLRKLREGPVAAHLRTDPRNYFGASLEELDDRLFLQVETMRRLRARPGWRPLGPDDD